MTGPTPTFEAFETTGTTPIFTPVRNAGGAGGSGGDQHPPDAQALIEGHLSALKELFKQPGNRNLVSPGMLRLDDGYESSEEEEVEVSPYGKGKKADDGYGKGKKAADGYGKGKMADDDLSKPFKEMIKCPFTKRIIEFSSPKHKIPTNLKLYQGTTDPDDHINRFTGAGNHEEWPMPVWCRMFQQTLDGKARGWFDKLPAGSIDSWDELQKRFLNRFSMLRISTKDLTEINKIHRKVNESLPDFKERWICEANHFPDAPEIMQIGSFLNGHHCPELAKRFSDKIPKTVDEMLERIDDFVRSEEAFQATELPKGERAESRPNPYYNRNDYQPKPSAGDYRRNNPRVGFKGRRNDYYAPYVAPRYGNAGRPDPRRNDIRRNETRLIDLDILTKTPKEILATEHQLRLPQPPPTKGKPQKDCEDRYCDYHGEKGHFTDDCWVLREELKTALNTGKLDHLVKDLRRGKRTNQGGNYQGSRGKVINMIRSLTTSRKSEEVGKEEWMNAPISFPSIPLEKMSDEPLIIKVETEGREIREVYVDPGASMEVMYGHQFERLDHAVKARLKKVDTTLTGFTGKPVRPMGVIDLEIRFGSQDLSRKISLEFAVIDSPSPYNAILGRIGLRKLWAVPSTIHSMVKFPTPGGIATLVTRQKTQGHHGAREEPIAETKEAKERNHPLGVIGWDKPYEQQKEPRIGRKDGRKLNRYDDQGSPNIPAKTQVMAQTGYFTCRESKTYGNAVRRKHRKPAE